MEHGAHVEAITEAGVSQTHIEIAWFGIHRDYQGQDTNTGCRCADALYATVEGDARSHENSAEDAPITLPCHVDNARGRKFWLRQGFRDFQMIEGREPGEKPQKYQRMVR